MEDIAINSVMAGLPPQCMKIVVAAVRAMLQPEFNLLTIQTTTSPIVPALIVSGPARDECEVNYGYGCLGPGWRANATIGRTIRLVLMNIGGARPGALSRATMGQPAKYTFAFAENEERAPWGTFGQSRGVAAGDSAVSMVGVTCLVSHMDNTSTTPHDLFAGLVQSVSYYGSNVLHHGGEVLLILGPEHAKILARAFDTREALQQALFEKAVVPKSVFSPQALKFLLRRRGDSSGAVKGTKVNVLDGPDQLLVVVAGGDGLYSMIGPTAGVTVAVTAPVVSGHS
jgi:hypothetical protein